MIQVLRPSLSWLWVQDERLFHIPLDVSEIPGVRCTEPEPGHDVWRVELPETVWMLEPVQAWLQRLGASQPTQHDTICADPPCARELYAHQHEGVAFFTKQSAVLGDGMGLGKTTVALYAAAALRVGDRPVLLVGPRSLRRVWQNELEAMGLPHADSFVALEGTSPGSSPHVAFWLARAHWIYVHYDIVHAWWSQISLRRPCVSIVDEAHLVRNGRTRRGKAAALALSSAEHRFLLTGTPILNRIGEWWNLLSLVTGKWTWGKPSEFITRYGGGVHNSFGGLEETEPTHVEELRARLTGCYLRRTIEDVALELPSLTRQVVEIDMDDVIARRYARGLFEEYDPAAVLRAVLGGNASRKTIAWLGRLRKLVSLAKLDATTLEVESALESGESVVVFTWQRATAEKIAFSLWGRHSASVIHGGILQNHRDCLISEFQIRAKPQALCATLESLSVGVTLHRARIVIMHDLDWVPANMLQAEARVYRIGQTRPVLSKWMVARNSLDQLFLLATRRKAEAMSSAHDVSAIGLADTLMPDELRDGVERLIEWARS